MTISLICISLLYVTELLGETGLRLAWGKNIEPISLNRAKKDLSEKDVNIDCICIYLHLFFFFPL